jgi:hypothetical protein
MYPLRPAKGAGDCAAYPFDPRDKRVGTIPVGTILYIQDGVNPLRGLTRPIVLREPWIVEAWLSREYTKWDDSTRSYKSSRIAGGHLALVRSLRNRNRVESVADWILLACIDAGLEKTGWCRRPGGPNARRKHLFTSFREVNHHESIRSGQFTPPTH